MYRICYSHNNFLYVPEDTRQSSDPSFVSNKKPRFTRSLSVLANLISDAIFGMKETTFNYTMDHGMITKGENVLNGCHEKLHKNESDFFLNPVPLPLPLEANLDILGVIGQSRMEFKTGYSVENKIKDGDLIDSLNGFSLSQWSIIITFLLILSTTTMFFERIILNHKKDKSSMKRIAFKCISHFILKDFIEFNPLSNHLVSSRILLITLTVYSFLCVLLFSSVFKTDLVTVTKPYVPYDYQDVIANKTGVILMSDDGYRPTFQKF